MAIAYPKPKPRKRLPFRIMKDGREICAATTAGRAEYKQRTLAMWVRDGGICCLCGEYVFAWELTFEHKRSRGNGGGFRDDRVEVNGVSHAAGNAAKGSVSYERYMELTADIRRRNCNA